MKLVNFLTKKNILFLSIAIGALSLISEILVFQIQNPLAILSYGATISVLYTFVMILLVVQIIASGFVVYSTKEKFYKINLGVNILAFIVLIFARTVTGLVSNLDSVSGFLDTAANYSSITLDDITRAVVSLILGYAILIVYGIYALVLLVKATNAESSGASANISEVNPQASGETVNEDSINQLNESAEELAEKTKAMAGMIADKTKVMAEGLGEKSKETAEELSKKTKEAHKEVTSFIKSKKGKAILIPTTVVVVLALAVGVYFGFIHKTEVDVRPYFSIEFEGESGKGEIVSTLDTQKIVTLGNDEDKKSFINKVSVEFDKTNNLKNGDKVTATYSLSTGNDSYNGYVIATKTKTFIVKGLDDYINDVKDISSKEMATLDNIVKEKLDKITNKIETTGSNGGYHLDSKEPIKIDKVDQVGKVLVKSEENNCSIYYVYRIVISGKERSIFGEEKKDVVVHEYRIFSTDRLRKPLQTKEILRDYSSKQEYLADKDEYKDMTAAKIINRFMGIADSDEIIPIDK
ncbi:hypothetical protein HCQ94_02890 [Actinomyces sp. zg-332]|uniref:hypothetical protein n=1 Tax=Actinomyces sp. zg-332 TaxID=2708340 RepID=UPI00142322E3|nr:hypothetical protein [Actinomyces sp. zg-332]QPK94664.1 hypothetical protein HCQ94_02890 [Actinomyces sp. zg-332]